jgi:hypothetical protein
MTAPQKLVGSLQMDTPEGETAYKVAQSAYDEMVQRGIYLPERPEFKPSMFVHDDGSPKLPQNIQELTDMEIGELYNIVEAYYSYVTGQFAAVTNQYSEATEIFKFIAAKVRLGKEGKQQDKTDRQIADRRYVLANAKALELKCLYNLLSKVKDKLEKDMMMISRNITLREQRIKTGGRVASIGRRRIAEHFRHPSEQLAEQHMEESEVPEEAPAPRVRTKRPPPRRPPRNIKR